jgi:hypothetical protein
MASALGRQGGSRKERSGTGTTLAIFFVVMIALLIVWRSVNSITKGRHDVRGRNRCGACGSLFKAVNDQHAGRCRKCGTRQSGAS